MRKAKSHRYWILTPWIVPLLAARLSGVGGGAASEGGTPSLGRKVEIQALAPPLKHYAGVSCARFSPDGRRVVTASLDNGARVWDATPGKLLGDLSEHDDAVLH